MTELADWLANASDDVRKLNAPQGGEPEASLRPQEARSEHFGLDEGEHTLLGDSDAERAFYALWVMQGGAQLVAQHRFHSKRRWRSDFASVEGRVLIEIEGGVYGKGGKRGRHVRGLGYTNDRIKYNAASFLGWVVISVTPAMITPEYVREIISFVRQRIAERAGEKRGNEVAD